VSAALIVLAKAPAPGRSKTRLCPPCTPAQAAGLAHAALADTLATATSVSATRHVIAVEGALDLEVARGFELIAQRGAGLDERLEAAFADVGAPALLIGMDTPQVTRLLLERALDTLTRPDVDAVIGPARDGGYWCVGLAHSVPGAFAGVPMSSPKTFAAQLRRLHDCGLRVDELPPLRDVDRFDDAIAVAGSIPTSRFAAALGALA
jgi:uncharacterized protein